MLIGQIVRYVIVGGGVTALQAAIYWLLASQGDWHPQAANLAGYGAAVVTGYLGHGAITFPGSHRQRHGASRFARFVAVSLVSLALNAAWVWVTISVLHGPLWAPIPLMSVVTPGIIFLLNRVWVFRADVS